MEILNYDEIPHFVDVFEEVQYGQVHLVTPALPLLVLRNLVTVLDDLASDQSWPFIQKVHEANDQNNALTFCPSAKMSVIPLTKHEKRNDFGVWQEMYRHIKYCFDINEKEAKCPDILFDFETSEEFDGNLALEVLKKFVAEDHDLNVTQRVFVLPEDFDAQKMKLEKFN